MKFNQVACQEVGAMEFSVDPDGKEICLYDFSQTSDYRDQRVYLNLDAATALRAWLDTVIPAPETVPAPEQSFVKAIERSPRRVQETPSAPMCGFCQLFPCICVSAPNRGGSL